MDLFQAMTVYVKVVEAGSMTAAALECGISTTMVGNHLRALEERLGMSLLSRTTRRQRLTEFGATYYQRCTEVLGMVADSERLAEQAQSAPQGTLRITAPLTFGSEILAPALMGFHQRCPQVRVEVVLTNQRIDLVEGGFDAAIRLGALEPSSLIARPLHDYTLAICAAPDYLARRGTPINPHQLTDHDCLAFDYPAGDDWSNHGKQWWMSSESGEVVVNVSGPLVINSSQGLYQAACAGLGVVMLPQALSRSGVASGQLVALLPEYDLPVRPMSLLYTQDRYRSAKVRSFVEYVVELWGK